MTQRGAVSGRAPAAASGRAAGTETCRTPRKGGWAGLGGRESGLLPAPPAPAGLCLHGSPAWGSIQGPCCPLLCKPPRSSPASVSCPGEQPRPSRCPKKRSPRARHWPLVPPVPAKQGAPPAVWVQASGAGRRAWDPWQPIPPAHPWGAHGPMVPEHTDATRPGWAAEGSPSGSPQASLLTLLGLASPHDLPGGVL